MLAFDSVALLGATFLATIARFASLETEVSFEGATTSISYAFVSVLATVLWLVFLASERLYDPDRLFRGADELSRVARGLSLGVVALILATYMLKMPGLSRLWTLLAWLFSVVAVTSGRLVLRLLVRSMRRRGRLVKRTLLVGSNSEAADIVRFIGAHTTAGYAIVGGLASSQADRLALDFCAPDVRCLGAARELGDIIIAYDIEAVIIASSAFDHDVLARMIAELRGTGVSIHVSSGLFEVLTTRVLVSEVSGVPLITVRGISLSPTAMLTKRVFDIVVSSAVVLLGLPVWIAVVLALKLDSPGPVFYRQQRIGKGGRSFGMFKFRSMVVDADARLKELAEANEASGPLFKMKDDPRITRVGKWMRRFSVDEFPQLLNVLKGEMSLVGPRPPLPSESEQYTDRHWRRMEVVPGMTGLWQVSGRSSLTFDEMVRLDLFYIENWSVGLDITIMARTVPAVLLARGAY